MPYKDKKRESSRTQNTYDVYIEIDIDCQELLEACDVEYTLCRDDDTQNELAFHLDREDYCDMFETIQFVKLNEQVIAKRLLNPELAEYVTKATLYTPYGDKITFE